MSITSFTIEGPPVGYMRARSTKAGHHYKPKKMRDYQKLVAQVASLHFQKPLEGDLGMVLFFYMPTQRRTDTDNLTKCIKDSLNKIAFDDDSQVLAELSFQYRGDKEPRAEVVIWRLGSVRLGMFPPAYAVDEEYLDYNPDNLVPS